MRELGLAPQDRVGVIALNSDRYLELYLGLPAAGFVLVPVNSRLAPAEMRAILADAGVSVLFADADYPGAAAVGQVLTMPDDYEDLIASADEVPLGDGVAEDDLAVLFYTSGTTGAAKGAMHTHRSLVSSALHFMATWPFDRQTRWLVASPMFHTGGIIAHAGHRLGWRGPRHHAQVRPPTWRSTSSSARRSRTRCSSPPCSPRPPALSSPGRGTSVRCGT